MIQTMCLITCNALERVSNRMISFSELVHFNFHPDSDLAFLLFFFGGGGVRSYWQVEVLLSLDEIVVLIENVLTRASLSLH